VEYSSAPAEKGGAPLRALSVPLFVLVLLGAAIMIIAMADIAGTQLCGDVTRADLISDPGGECFDGSSAQKTIGLVLGFAGGGLGVIAALMAIAYTFTGRRGRSVLVLTGAAVLLSVASIVVGSV
jgi:hypothetical protein